MAPDLRQELVARGPLDRATAKRVFPVILVFAIFAALLAATIAIRLAIWLPLYFSH